MTSWIVIPVRDWRISMVTEDIEGRVVKIWVLNKASDMASSEPAS